MLPPHRSLPGLAYAALALWVLGSHWLLIAWAGNATPFWDQWDVDAPQILLPWVRHSFHWADLLLPQNEHHIVPTRALTLLLFLLNHGVWNPLLQMSVNALLHTAALTLYVVGLNRLLPLRAQALLLAGSAVFFSLPFGWENTLWGFQSQFYFLLLFSIGFLWAVAVAPIGGWRWWLGMAGGALAAVSMVSGLITLLTGAVLLALRLHRGDDGRWRGSLLILVYLGLALLAWRAIPVMAGSAPALTPATFLNTLTAVLCWPFPVFSTAAELALAVLYFIYLLRRPSSDLRVRIFLPLAAIYLLLRLLLPAALPDAAGLLLLPILFLPLRWLAEDSGQPRLWLPALACLWLLLTTDWQQLTVSAAALSYLPLWLFTVRQLSSPPPARDPRWLALAAGIWLAGQYACIADGRPMGFASSRYRDIYDLGLLLNAALLLAWSTGPGAALPWRSRLLPLLWLALVLIGLQGVLLVGIGEIDFKRQAGLHEEANMRAYLRSGDPAALDKTPYAEIPFITGERLRRQLDQPEMRAMLPPNLNPANGSRQPAWVSLGLRHLHALAELALALGLLLGLVAAVRRPPGLAPGAAKVA